MGAAASTSVLEDKYKLSLEETKALAGDRFDQAKWNEVSEDGAISKEQWEELIAKVEPAAETSAEDAAESADAAAAADAAAESAESADVAAAADAVDTDAAKTEPAIEAEVAGAAKTTDTGAIVPDDLKEAGPGNQEEEEYTSLTQCLKKIGANIKKLRDQLRGRQLEELQKQGVCVLVQTGAYNPCRYVYSISMLPHTQTIL